MASTIQTLERSLKDIDGGGWVCGDLCRYDSFNVKKPKMMACAVGLISLHGGHTINKSLTIAGKTFDVKYAVYPEDNETRDGKKAPKNVREALEYLALSIPKRQDRTIEEYDLSYDSPNYGELLSEVVVTRKNVKDIAIHELSNLVVTYNDDDIGLRANSAKAARAWFARALKLAQKDAGISPASVATPEAAKALSFA